MYIYVYIYVFIIEYVHVLSIGVGGPIAKNKLIAELNTWTDKFNLLESQFKCDGVGMGWACNLHLLK